MIPKIKDDVLLTTSVHTVSRSEIGRADLMGEHIYTNPYAYKPIMHHNGLRNPFACRTSLRPWKESLIIELKNDGTYDDSVLNEKIDSKEVTKFDWDNYEDKTHGVITDLDEGRILFVPDLNQSQLFIEKYR